MNNEVIIFNVAFILFMYIMLTLLNVIQKVGTMPRYKTRLYYKTLYNKTKEWLQGEIDNTELTEELCESNDDFLVYGRKECAESLINKMEQDWEVK